MEKLEIAIKCDGEMDEFWSYVGNKSNQRWTWYAIERNSGCILAWHNGKRQDKDFWYYGTRYNNLTLPNTTQTIGLLMPNTSQAINTK